MRGTKALMVTALLALCAVFAVTACDEIKEKIEEAVATCADVCQKINDCGASPPPAYVPDMDVPAVDNGAVNCVVNCGQADTRAMHGYSECQLDCLNNAECGTMNDCWDTKSDLYNEKCLSKREEGPPKPVEPPAEAPPEAKEPANDTKTGNGEVDDIIEDPAVQAAVEKGGGGGEPFVVNQGSKPPQLLGEYAVQGSIDDAKNARPVGAKINTAVCFKDLQENPAGRAKGWYVTYCEKNVSGEDTAPITGTEDGKFTAFFVFEGAATVLFSGTVVEGKATGVEALVVYASGVDVWEHSNTDWQNKSLTCSCPL
jgi:hypothetical protein